VLPSLQRRTLSDEVCLACLAVFCFSFLLGSNYNYRLIFLLGTLPRLIEEWEARGGWQRLLTPCLVLALLWAVRLPTWAGHGANWLGYLAACAWLAASLPPTALTSASARRSRTAQVRAGTVSGVRREVTQVQTGWRR
jgi:hypothetical protein